jgi:release factor glutamine methyltransferase
MAKPWYIRASEPILVRIYRWYVSTTRTFRYKGTHVSVPPGIFYPGFIYSTGLVLDYLETVKMEGRRVLDMGTGSGIIALRCAARGATVTAADINPDAVATSKSNADRNGLVIRAVLSDLFDALKGESFDLIVINPPYYPKDPVGMAEYAWFCGEDFGYFKRLFAQLALLNPKPGEVLMALGETAPVERILAIAADSGVKASKLFGRRQYGETTIVYRLILPAN